MRPTVPRRSEGASNCLRSLGGHRIARTSQNRIRACKVPNGVPRNGIHKTKHLWSREVLVVAGRNR